MHFHVLDEAQQIVIKMRLRIRLWSVAKCVYDI